VERRNATLFVTVAACAIFVLAGRPAHANAQPRLPAVGQPFSEAELDLLGQGLTLAQDTRRIPDSAKPGLRYDRGPPLSCYALFLYRRPDGWGDYIVVSVDPIDKRVTEARFAQFADRLVSIPPPEPPDVPKLKGTYFAARARLRAIGYVPMRTVGEPARVCTDKKCKNLVELPEAQCAMDIPICNTFWRSPKGRVLKVMTIGEIKAGDVYYVIWSTRREQRDLTN
jgi:hypothetical protein